MVTDAFDAFAYSQFPAAQFLYRWLVRKNKTGTVIEIDLDEFNEWVAEVRGRPYDWKWAKKAFTLLHEQGFIDVVHKYNRHEYKIQVLTEGDSVLLDFNECSGERKPTPKAKNPKKTRSKPGNSVCRSKENIDSTTEDPPTNHPVVVEKFNSKEEKSDLSNQEGSKSPDLCDEAPKELNGMQAWFLEVKQKLQAKSEQRTPAAPEAAPKPIVK